MKNKTTALVAVAVSRLAPDPVVLSATFRLEILNPHRRQLVQTQAVRQYPNRLVPNLIPD